MHAMQLYSSTCSTTWQLLTADVSEHAKQHEDCRPVVSFFFLFFTIQLANLGTCKAFDETQKQVHRQRSVSRNHKNRIFAQLGMMKLLLLTSFLAQQGLALIPFLDGGKGMPKLYDGWFNEQVSKQAASAVSKAIAAGKRNIEVNFPPVPNVEGRPMLP
jgi:hypothetical protein